MVGRKRAPGGGRKPKAPQDKKVPVSTRVLPAIRSRLMAAAEQQRKSLAEIVETALEESLEAQFAPPHIMALADSIARAAVAVEGSTGEKWTDNRFTFDTVQSAIEQFMRAVATEKFPPGAKSTPPDKLVKQVESQRQYLGKYADDLLTVEGLAFFCGVGQHVIASSAAPLPKGEEYPQDIQDRMARSLRIKRSLQLGREKKS